MMGKAAGLRAGPWSFLLALAAIVSLGIFPRPAPGQGPQVLTLEKARRIALERNRDVQQAREKRNAVEGRYVEERAAALPQLTLSAGISRDRDESQRAFSSGFFPLERDTRSAELGLSQALYTFGKIGAGLRAARSGIALSEEQMRLSRQAAVREVSIAFYDILLVRENRALALEILGQKRRHLEVSRRKEAAGVATAYDVLAAEVALENARPEVIRLTNQVQILKERLRYLLALEQEVEVEGSLEVSIGTYPEYIPAMGTALRNRPELSELLHRRRIAQELVTIAETGTRPRVDLKAGYGWREMDFGDLQGAGQVWTAGVFLTFPFFDGLRTEGRVRQSKSDLASLRIEEAKQVDAISLQVRQAIDSLREAGEIVRALSGTVGQAERLLFMAERGYEYGVKTRLDLDDAQLNLTQARSNLARAKRDYLAAGVNFAWALGELDK